MTTLSTLQIQPAYVNAPIDAPLGLRVSGCQPRASVVVKASIEVAGSTFASSGIFEADDLGRVDTATDPSRGGTYTGVDAFGLWWSGNPVASAPASSLAPVIARLRVESGSESVETVVERPWLAPGATLAPVGDAGVSGVFARPAGPGPFPGIVVFGGSSGGLGPTAAWAASLASHGFASLAISYFGAPGLPLDLVNIEVECVERAVAWLLRRTDVTSPVGVMGVSRGSELALLAGALLEGVAAVVAFAPSGVAWNGLSRRGPVDAPTWTFRGQPLPYASTALSLPENTDVSQPIALRSLFEPALKDPSKIAAAEIPVERTRGPILLVSGESDAMWPATPMAEIVERRAARHHFAYPVRHLRYPEAGHVCCGSPGTPLQTHARLPLDGGLYAFGGSRAANAAARADSWPRVLDFLASALGRPRRD